TDALAAFIFEQVLNSVGGNAKFIHVTRADCRNLPRALHCGSERVDGVVPIEQAPLPTVVWRNVIVFVPADPSLVLRIVNGEYGGHTRKLRSEEHTSELQSREN